MRLIYVFLLAISLSACAPKAIPMRASLSDTLISNTQTSVNSVDLSYSSSVKDGVIQLINQKSNSGDPGYIHTESSTFNKMLREYAQMRFNNVSTDSPTKVVVTLDDFSIDQNTPNSDGEMAAAALFGGEIKWVFSATVKATTTVTKDGKTFVKKHIATVEGDHVSGIGTGTKTSSYNRGTEATEYVHAANILSANNKIILQIDSFLDSLSL